MHYIIFHVLQFQSPPMPGWHAYLSGRWYGRAVFPADADKKAAPVGAAPVICGQKAKLKLVVTIQPSGLP